MVSGSEGREGRADFLRRHLADLEVDIKAMRRSKSWQALVAANRQVLATRAELDQIDKAAPAAEEGMTEADLVDALVAAIPTLPLSALPAIETAIARRKG